MIDHIVMLSLKAPPDEALSAAMKDLADLTEAIDGFAAFTHGPNIDAEGKSPDYPYGFICQFQDRAALDRYAADPRHQAIGARLVAMCKGGAEGIMVYDLAS